jgi:hypothetical protein
MPSYFGIYDYFSLRCSVALVLFERHVGMDTSLQFLLPMGLALLSVVVAGVYMLNRGRGIYLNNDDNVREALMWGGGFIVYAVFDYMILMH